ncbi:hypothetical protein M9458_045975, partial [Cirrhinus mrigala]
RDNSSSFKSNRPAYGSYSPRQTSPTSPQPLYENVSGAKGSPTRLDFPTEEGTSPHEPQLDNTSTSEDKPVGKDKKAKKNESSQGSDQDTPSKEESSDEDSDESELKPNANTECSNIKDQKTPEKVGDDGPSGAENGIA